MRVKKNGKVITLTESDLMRITKKVLREQEDWKGADKSEFNFAQKTTEHGKFLKSLTQKEYDMFLGRGGFQQYFLPKALGKTWEQIKKGTIQDYMDDMAKVLKSRSYDDSFSTNSITYFREKFGEDVVRGLQEKLANSGYTQYKPDGSVGKSNLDGDFGTGTAKMLLDVMYKRFQAVKDKSQLVGGGAKDADSSKYGKPNTEAGTAQPVQPRN